MNEGAEAGLKEGSFPRQEVDISVEDLAARETRYQAPRPRQPLRWKPEVGTAWLAREQSRERPWRGPAASPSQRGRPHASATPPRGQHNIPFKNNTHVRW